MKPRTTADIPMVKLSADEKAHITDVPDYMLETLPHAANAVFMISRRNMAQMAKSPDERRFTMPSFITAIQIVVNLADDDDLKRQICAWIMAGKITSTPASQ
jgi:hypothetical protein